MKYIYKLLENADIEPLFNIVKEITNHYDMVGALHYYLLGDKAYDTGLKVNMPMLQTNIGLRALCDMIKTVTMSFDGIYEFGTVADENVSGVELAAKFAKIDIKKTISVLKRYILWKTLYTSLISVLDEYIICDDDWGDIIESKLSDSVKLLMVYTCHIIKENAVITDNADVIISTMFCRIIETFNNRLESDACEPDGYFASVCRKWIRMLSKMFYSVKHENLMDFFSMSPPWIMKSVEILVGKPSTNSNNALQVTSGKKFSLESCYISDGELYSNAIDTDIYAAMIYQEKDGTTKVIEPSNDKKDILHGWSVYDMFCDGWQSPNMSNSIHVDKIIITSSRGVIRDSEGYFTMVHNIDDIIIFDRGCYEGLPISVHINYPISTGYKQDVLVVKYTPSDGKLVVESTEGITVQIRVRVDFIMPSIEKAKQENPDSTVLSQTNGSVYCGDDNRNDKFRFIWVCSMVDYKWCNMYRFFNASIPVPQIFIDALTTGHLVITIGSPLYAVAKEFVDGRPHMTKYDKLVANVTNSPDDAGVYHVDLCEKFDLDVTASNNVLTFTFIPTSDTNSIFSTDEWIDVVLYYHVTDDGTAAHDVKEDAPTPSNISKVEQNPVESGRYCSSKVRYISEDNEHITFRWESDNANGYKNMYVYHVASIEVPEKFANALREGRVSVRIDVSMCMVKPEDDGTKRILYSNLGETVVQCMSNDGGVYYANIGDMFGIHITKMGNTLIMSGMMGKYLTLPLLCCKDAVNVTMTIFDDVAPLTIADKDTYQLPFLG